MTRLVQTECRKLALCRGAAKAEAIGGGSNSGGSSQGGNDSGDGPTNEP